MRQHGVAIATLRGQVRGHIGQPAFGHGHRLHAAHALHGVGPFNRRHVHHGGLRALGLHHLHFVQHGQHRADELNVVLLRHVLRVDKIIVDEFLADFFVFSGSLGEVFQHLNEGSHLAWCHVHVGHVLAQ